jgi:glycerol-3-phosphate dehydrogenase (NAD(P)+)
MAIFTVVGAGMMGSALCVPLVDAGHEVRLVGTHLDTEIVKSLKESGVHPKMGIELPAQIRPFFVEELASAMRDVEAIGVGVSSPGVRWAGEKLAPFVKAELPIAMITKGLEWDGQNLRVLPDVLRDCFPKELARHVAPAAIAGPCIAGELARRVETVVVVTSRDAKMLDRLEKLLRAPYYFPVKSHDVEGTEVCAALKNAYAMGIGFAQGIHEARGGAPGSVAMHNYESAVFAQAVLEMQRVVQLVGGRRDSAAGLAGVGDLDVTTNGGRTGRFGKWLGTGLSRDQAVEKMAGATLECLDILAVMQKALPALEEQGTLSSDELPLLRHLCEVALDGAPLDMPFAKFFQQD